MNGCSGVPSCDRRKDRSTDRRAAIIVSRTACVAALCVRAIKMRAALPKYF